MVFFDEVYQTFQAFSPAHFAALGVLAVLFVLMQVFRKKIGKTTDLVIRRGVAILMIFLEWTFYAWALSRGGFQTTLLPFGVCAIAMYATAYALWTNNERVFRWIFPWAIVGALLSLTVADVSYTFPHFRYLHYFGNHGLFLLGNLYLLTVSGFKFGYRDLLKSSLALLVYAAIIYPLNFLLNANHLFLRELPHEVAFLYAPFGALWPLGFALSIFILFHVIYAPVWIVNRLKQRKQAHVDTPSNLVGVDGTLRSPHWKKEIRWFVTGQLISLIGSMLVQYAITWYIVLETESGLMMTLSILAGFLPSLLLSPLAGAWADRYDRKKLIIVADAMIAFVTFLTAIVFLLGYREIWLLLVISVFRSLGGAIHQPSVNAVYPDLVPADRLMRVQGLVSGFAHTMMIFAPVIAAALIALVPLEAIFAIDVVTAIMAIATLLLFVKLPKPKAHDTTEQVSHWNDIKLGLKYIREHAFLIPFFIYTAIILFMVAPVAFLTPLQVVRRFGSEVWRLSTIEIAFSVGMTVGSLLVAALGGFKNRIHTMILAMVVMGLGTFLLGIVGGFWWYLVFMAMIGIMLPFYNTPSAVMMQEKVEGAYLGRVFSVLGMISASAMPLGMLVFGPMADFVDIEWILIGSGLAMAVAAITMLSNRRLVHAGIPKPIPASISETVS
jgi:MFS transporter, DHA3 family, macrolide efflux protein